jgi:GxxExxY protein
MQMDDGDARLLLPVTERIIGCAFRVANALGHGFLRKGSRNALAYEMWKSGFCVVQQRRIVVFCDDAIVGEFTAGLLVEDQVRVELKVVGGLSDVHLPQCRDDHSSDTVRCPMVGETANASHTEIRTGPWRERLSDGSAPHGTERPRGTPNDIQNPSKPGPEARQDSAIS